MEDKKLRLQVEIQGLRQQKTDLQQMLAQHKCSKNNVNNIPISNSVTNNVNIVLDSNNISETVTPVVNNTMTTTKRNPLQQQNISANVNSANNSGNNLLKCSSNSVIQPNNNKTTADIPTTVAQQNPRRRPTTLLQLNNGNFEDGKKISSNGSTGVVVLNFDSLMDGGTGLTPVSTGNHVSVSNHHQQVQRENPGGNVGNGNNSVLS